MTCLGVEIRLKQGRKLIGYAVCVISVNQQCKFLTVTDRQCEHRKDAGAVSRVSARGTDGHVVPRRRDRLNKQAGRTSVQADS